MTRTHSNAVVLFARNPVPGQVKTRLQSKLSPEEACALYRAFLDDARTQLLALSAADCFVAVHGGEGAGRAFEAFAEAGIQVVDQAGADLGERMAAVFSARFGEGYETVVIIGSDSPTLPVNYLEQALETRRDLVLGPSTDGGYYLIGMKDRVADVFQGIPWGTEKVLAETLARTVVAGTSVDLLAPWYDVDHPEDLDFLKTHLGWMRQAGLPGGDATRKAIEELNLG